MAYEKTNWKNRQGAGLNKFKKSEETSDYVYLTNEPDVITEQGTPFSVENMNKIERGIYEAHESKQSKIINATCSTAAATAAKAVTIEDYTLTAGDVLAITYTNGNTANSATINVNGAGAKAVSLGGGAPTGASGTGAHYIAAGRTALYHYNGTYFCLTGSQDITDSNTESELTAAVTRITTIEGKIPNQASANNQLADKDFVNSSVTAMAAHQLTYNAAGNPFPTKAALNSAATFYYKGTAFSPTEHDYCVVQADESQNGAQVRYVYNGVQWIFGYKINDKPFTAEQSAAIDSGATTAIIGSVANKVDTSGNQTINGIKTFGSLPVLPSTAPVNNNQAASKAYVDSKLDADSIAVDVSKKAYAKKNRYTITSNTIGHLIKTNIANTEIGNAKLSIRASFYTTAGMIDTELDCFINGASITANSMQQLNKGFNLPPIIACLNTDNTWSFFIKHNKRYVHIAVDISLRNATNSSTSSAFSETALENRCTEILAISATEGVPTSANAGYIKVPDSLVFGAQNTKETTLYIATQDGDDSNTGTSRAQSLKTVAAAIARAKGNERLFLYINASVTAAPAAYNSSTAYAAGDRVTYNGYTYERVTAGTGTTPSVTATVWKFVPMDTVTQGNWSASTAYAAGDTVFKNSSTGQKLSYVCMAANTGEPPADTYTKYWALAGLYNPIIPATTIAHMKEIVFVVEASTYNAAQPYVICTGSLTLSKNTLIHSDAKFLIAGTLTMDYVPIFRFEGSMVANAISANYDTTGRFEEVTAWSYITHNKVKIYYNGAVTVGVTDTASRAAITISTLSDVVFCGNLIADGYSGAVNTGTGIYVSTGATVTVLGNVTLRSFGTAINVATGSTYANYSATTTMIKSNYTGSTNPAAIKVDDRSTFISSKGASYVRTNTNDNISGNFIDLSNIEASTLLGLADINLNNNFSTLGKPKLVLIEGQNLPNAPASGWGFCLHMEHRNTNRFARQLFMPFSSNDIYTRAINEGTPSAWVKIFPNDTTTHPNQTIELTQDGQEAELAKMYGGTWARATTPSARTVSRAASNAGSSLENSLLPNTTIALSSSIPAGSVVTITISNCSQTATTITLISSIRGTIGEFAIPGANYPTVTLPSITKLSSEVISVKQKDGIPVSVSYTWTAVPALSKTAYLYVRSDI